MSVEKDIAFLEDYQFMLATGESHDTAATRFGCSPNSLEKRVWRATDRLRRVMDDAETTSSPSRIGDTTQTTPAARQRCNPGPNHREGVAS